MAARKHNEGYYNKATLTSIRAAIDRHLPNEPNNKLASKTSIERSKCFIRQTINLDY